MPRPAKFDSDDLLDGALAVVRTEGAGATIAQISRAAGAPVGSIYHRFGSREQLLASLWVRSIGRFHEGLLAAAELDDADRALAQSAVHVVQYCREHPDEARAMTLYRQPAAAAVADGALREAALHVNDRINAATRRLTRMRYGRATDWRLELVAVAIRQLPYGLVRPYIGSAPVPPWLDDVVLTASRAALELGEGSRPH